MSSTRSHVGSGAEWGAAAVLALLALPRSSVVRTARAMWSTGSVSMPAGTPSW